MQVAAEEQVAGQRVEPDDFVESTTFCPCSVRQADSRSRRVGWGGGETQFPCRR